MGRLLRSRSSALPLNLPQLQNLIKRDPQSYRDEFMQQFHHCQSRLALFKLRLHEEDKDLVSIISFMSHVAVCYPNECVQFPQQLIELLQNHAQILHQTTRKGFVQALILLRSKNLVRTERYVPSFEVGGRGSM
jgi:protein SDA1